MLIPQASLDDFGVFLAQAMGIQLRKHPTPLPTGEHARFLLGERLAVVRNTTVEEVEGEPCLEVWCGDTERLDELDKHWGSYLLFQLEKKVPDGSPHKPSDGS
jgi:hypothetical protein